VAFVGASPPNTAGRSAVVSILLAVLTFESLIFSSAAFAQISRPAATATLSTSDIAKQASPSVVTITTSTGQGSGVIADPNGLIVTNLHVIRGDTKVSVKLANGDIYDDVTIVQVDERRDLLLLRIKAVDLRSLLSVTRTVFASAIRWSSSVHPKA
jgi:S1-C subfamily serine protease